MIWRGGCIIRARFLHRIKEAYDAQPEAGQPDARPVLQGRARGQPRRSGATSVATAAKLGVPAPAFSSALAYFDSYRRGRLPANLIQAQRDYFGAHTYERTDKTGVFHTEWTK